MPTLHVRNVADRLYDDLRRRAAAAGRSLSAEVIGLLGAAVHRRTGIDPEVLARLRDHRAALERTHGRFPSSVDEIRADRER
jgi:plasmid stability protein